MLWEVEIRPFGRDAERERVCDEFDLLTHSTRGGDLLKASARGFLLEGYLDRDAAEQIVTGPLRAEHLALGKPYTFKKVTVALLDLDDDGLVRLSREGQLALNLDEMRAVQAHFREQGRDPSDVELETIAQTWSE